MDHSLYSQNITLYDKIKSVVKITRFKTVEAVPYQTEQVMNMLVEDNSQHSNGKNTLGAVAKLSREIDLRTRSLKTLRATLRIILISSSYMHFSVPQHYIGVNELIFFTWTGTVRKKTRPCFETHVYLSILITYC